jgi:hypothetical protein
MILLVTGADGVRDVITDVAAVKAFGIGGSRTIVQVILNSGETTDTIELHDARVELLPDAAG